MLQMYSCTYISPGDFIHVNRSCLTLLLDVGAADLKKAVDRPTVVLAPELQPLAVSARGGAYGQHEVVNFLFLQLRQIHRAAAQ